MALHNLLGDGQAQSRPAGAGGAGGVQPVELLEDVGQLPLGDLQPLVADGDLRLPAHRAGVDVHPAAGGAVADGVSQYVIEDPGKFVRVSGHHQVVLDFHAALELLLREEGVELVGELLQQHGQLDGLALLRRAVQIHAGDVEELPQQLLQPPGLVQGDAGVLGPLLRRQARVVLQQGQVAHHRGQRGLEIVGQEGHQIPPALLALPGGLLPGPELPLDGVEILLDGGELPGQHHRLLVILHHPAGGGADVVQPAGEPAHGQIEGDEHEHHGGHREDLLLVGPDIAVVELQGALLALAEQGDGRPLEKAGEGILQHPVDDHLQQEDAHRPGDHGAQHHQQEHFQL